MASAFVAAHCVHTDLLAAPVVDTALVGVCRREQSPVAAAHCDQADTVPPLSKEQREGTGSKLTKPREGANCLRDVRWAPADPTPPPWVSWHRLCQDGLKFRSGPNISPTKDARSRHTLLSRVQTQTLPRPPRETLPSCWATRHGRQSSDASLNSSYSVAEV